MKKFIIAMTIAILFSCLIGLLMGCATLPTEPTDGPKGLPTNEADIVDITIFNSLDEPVEVWVYQGSNFNDELYNFYVNPNTRYYIKLQKDGVYKVCIILIFGTEVDAKCVLKKTMVNEEWTIQKNK